MTELNYFSSTTEKEILQLTPNNSSENKIIDFKHTNALVITCAVVAVLSLSNATNSNDHKMKKNTYSSYNQLVNPVSMNKYRVNHQTNVKSIDVNKLIDTNKNKLKEMIKVQQEINGSIIKFENFVIKLGLFLAILFLTLSLPIFIGYPSLIGFVMSIGLLVFIKIRKWERGE